MDERACIMTVMLRRPVDNEEAVGFANIWKGIFKEVLMEHVKSSLAGDRPYIEVVPMVVANAALTADFALERLVENYDTMKAHVDG